MKKNVQSVNRFAWMLWLKRAVMPKPQLDRYVVLYCAKTGMLYVYSERAHAHHRQLHAGDRVLWTGRANSAEAALYSI